jgi:poly(3-hydroxybutyrate) depolymerase
MTGYLGSAPASERERSIARPNALERRFGNEAGSRTYDLFVPSRYGREPLPFVVMLHGCSQTSRDFAIGTRMDEFAEEQAFLVAYPDQPRSANVTRTGTGSRTATNDAAGASRPSWPA